MVQRITCWLGTSRVFGRPRFCPLPKKGLFDENGENDEFAFYPLKTRALLLRPPKTTKMTKMAGVTQEKAWFRKSRVCSFLNMEELVGNYSCQLHKRMVSEFISR